MWIGDVFGRDRGESIELDDIPDLFHRSREMDVLERPDNHIILGAKGSGKSTALRALTIRAWQQRGARSRLPFAGIYIPMSFEDVSIFKTAFDEQQSTEVFEHFIAATTLHHLYQQWNAVVEDSILVDLVRPYLRGSDSLSGVNVAITPFLDDRFAALKAIHAAPTIELKEIDLKCKHLSILSLRELAERYANVALREQKNLPPRLALLFDSFDYYGQLGSCISPLLQSDSGTPIVTKLAARTLHIRDVFSAAPNRMLELTRDYHVITMDRESDSPDHQLAVKETICKRVRNFCSDEANGLSDDQIIALLFHDATDDDEDLTSFDSFCRLSSGNVLAAILLLDKAAELQRSAPGSKPDMLDPMQREFRLAAANDLSQMFWDFEIGVRVPAQKVEASVFCDVALGTARAGDLQNRNSPRFRLTSVMPDKSLIANMLATRVLTAIDDSVNRRVQSGHEAPAEIEFEVNRMLLPRKGWLPRRGTQLDLERPSFDNAYKKGLKSAKPHLSPRSARQQQDLFRKDFTVFISMPFEPAKKSRTVVLRKSINRIYRELTQREGGEGISYIDIHFFPHVGPFREEIPGYIRDSSYVVADISDIADSADRVPGVFYEIGVAMGERKPLALFFNCRGRNARKHGFDVKALPSVLRGESVSTWGDQSESFHDEFVRIHEKLMAFNGLVGVPHWKDPSSLSHAKSERQHAYLSFQPRNYLARDWFESLIRRMFPELSIETTRDWQQTDLELLYGTISKASICIVDCTGKINAQALELGLAATTGLPRVVEVWNSELDTGVNPVAMFPGKKWAWANLDMNDERQAVSLLQDIGRATPLGGRRWI